MNAKADTQQAFHMDWLKWLFVIALVAVGVIGNSFYGDQPIIYRVLVLLVLGLIALFAVLKTAKGAALWVVLKEAQVEVRKVVWPSRQETNQTTLIVVGLVIVMAFILWGLDTLLGWLASIIIG